MTTTRPFTLAAEFTGLARVIARSWRWRATTLLAIAVGLGCGATHLTDHVGYASSLVVGLVGSAVSSIAGVRLQRAAKGVRGAALALAASGFGIAFVALALLVVFAHALVGPACASAEGAAWVLLVALPGPVLAALFGAALGASLPGRRAATLVAAATVPAFIVWSLARFYASPAVFAFDPFFGFFPGAIYDEHVPLTAAHVTYRVGTLGWIAMLAALLAGGLDAAGRFSLRTLGAGPRALALAGALTGLSVFAAGDALGHRHDAASVHRGLGGTARGRRCIVAYDRSLDRRLGELTARDCDVRVAQLEAFFGTSHPAPITVFLFANATQKRAWMGAEDTYIAKPWRDEVYLQAASFPHPVLKHELAHVVAGAFAGGPFRVAAWAGWLPAPALIEGAAVAAAWEGDSDATPHQWTRAMLEAGLAPPMASLVGLGFFAASSGRAYTAAGSFCRWLVETRGAARFRRFYRDVDAFAAYGATLPELERAWHDDLRRVPTPEAMLTQARTRFRRASVFGRTCPLLLDALAETAAGRVASGDVAGAIAAYEALLRHDPTDLHVRTQIVALHVRAGDDAAVQSAVADAEAALGPAAGTRARMVEADQRWRWFGPRGVRRRYVALDGTTLDADEARTLRLKILALDAAVDAEALRDLLIGRGPLEPSAIAAMARLAEAPPGDPLAAYLRGRQLFLAERFDAALAALDVGAVATTGEPRIVAETLRLRAIAMYRLGERDAALGAFEALASDVDRSAGYRAAAADWADRVRRERSDPRP